MNVSLKVNLEESDLFLAAELVSFDLGALQKFLMFLMADFFYI